MKENSRELKMAIIFRQFPDTKEFHVTSDDQAFFQAGDAKNHASTLEDKAVDVVNRRDVVGKVQINEPKTEDTPAKPADKKPEAKADPAKEERITLFARIEELGGTAAKTLGTAKLKEKVAELEAAKTKEQESQTPEELEAAKAEEQETAGAEAERGGTSEGAGE